uniref:Exostosin GT47 domain-containing protein n=1 Tax=Oryza brachyantha TaxID=4533 RepID=J3N364_ORYBR
MKPPAAGTETPSAATESQKDGGGGLLRPSWMCYMVVLSTVFWFLVVSLHSGVEGGLSSALFKPSGPSLPLLDRFTFEDQNPAPEPVVPADPCAGRYIYMYDMPARFNEELLRDCYALRPWMGGMCRYVVNGGMGEPLGDEGGVFSERGWFATDQFLLDIIFHGRMKRSHFCLQPRGDTMTRRSTFDTILAGCIPVFFHPGSAYDQYTLHLPPEHGSYSVLVLHSDVAGPRNVSIEETLRAIPPEKVRSMREEVIRLIPTVVYADTRSSRVDFRDAFDVAVDAVLDRVARRQRGEPDAGK